LETLEADEFVSDVIFICAAQAADAFLLAFRIEANQQNLETCMFLAAMSHIKDLRIGNHYKLITELV
jgi:hypothetical protein